MWHHGAGTGTAANGEIGEVIWGEKDGAEGREMQGHQEEDAALLDLGSCTVTLHVRVEVSSWGMNAGKEQTVFSPLNLPCTTDHHK